MITFFNRVALIKDTDAETVANVWSALRKEDIKYEVVTKTHTSAFKRMLTQQRNININMGGTPASWMEHPADYLYIVYVNKKDYEKAKQICSL